MSQNERMLPIVWGLVPTIVGAAMLISLKGPDHKGALLFGMISLCWFVTSEIHYECSELHRDHLW